MKSLLLRQMWWNTKAKAEDLLGLQINRVYRHGYSECIDIKRSGCQIAIVFDVGAHIGQSALKFKIAFPKARIFCFEPVRYTFEILKKNTDSYIDISCNNIALGSSDGQATVYLTRHSTTNSLIKPNTITGSEAVEIRTVDGFASENLIERIDLLKIDAEGLDLSLIHI